MEREIDIICGKWGVLAGMGIPKEIGKKQRIISAWALAKQLSTSNFSILRRRWEFEFRTAKELVNYTVNANLQLVYFTLRVRKGRNNNKKKKELTRRNTKIGIVFSTSFLLPFFLLSLSFFLSYCTAYHFRITATLSRYEIFQFPLTFLPFSFPQWTV